MEWKMENGRPAPAAAVDVAEASSVTYRVPVGILLGTVECESDFRLGVVSSAGAVGPCQFQPKYAEDYYRYAGFRFDLTSWESIAGMAAIFVFYAKLGAERYGFAGDDLWRFAMLAHRYGQNSEQAKTLQRKGRVDDVERMMWQNGLWYDTPIPEEVPGDPDSPEEPEAPQGPGAPQEPEAPPEPEEPDAPEEPEGGRPAACVAQGAALWAMTKLGSRYSQADRGAADAFDCSSLVARAYAAQGVSWALVGSAIPNSSQEVYSDAFELLWPETYAQIGKTLGGASVLERATQAGDLQFLCTDKSTKRANRITHVTIVVDGEEIVHARSTRYGVRTDPLTLYRGKACALLRYNPEAPLRLGMRGLRVQALQKALNARGAKLDVDGIYGRKTEEAVARYGAAL